MMRWMQFAAAGLVTEAAAHFLSLSWGFALLVFLVVVTGLRQQHNTAQTVDLAARHAALVVSVGAVKDTADTASSAASAAQTTANNAQSTANNALPKSGGTITNDLTVNGTHTAGYVVADNSVTAYGNLGVHGDSTLLGTLSVEGATMPQNEPNGVSAPPSGGSPGSTIAGSQYCGSFYSGSGAANWASAITNAHNSLLTTLVNAGVLT